MMRAILLILLLSVGAVQAETPLYKDSTQPVDARVADLLSRMTLEEKVAQIQCVWRDKNKALDEDGRFVPEKAAEAFPHGIGCVARPSDNWQRGTAGVDRNRTPTETVELVNAFQKWLLEETRLGIPTMMHEEGLHGFQAHGATSFPQAIALASTWDPEFVEKVYTTVAAEIRAWGPTHVLSPVVDVGRDPRWGRIEETYGEDPHLVAEMGLAAVRGFQGRRDQGSDEPLPEGRVFATLKHMTGHGQPQSGTNVGPSQISERILREMFFPPFERAIQEADAASVMASYNEIDGIPSHANVWLLRDVLRDEWKFNGYVVADYYAIDQLQSLHHVASSLADAAVQALRAGVDVELPNPAGYPFLIEQVKNGIVDEKMIDEAVARGLRYRFLAGLFDDPYADADYAEELTGNAAARKLAERAAEKAVILLKNEDNLLPLKLDELKKIAIIGPNANETILGGYTDKPKQTVSILDGVRTYVGDRAEVVFSQGSHITKDRNWFADEVELWEEDVNQGLIRAAAQVARQADVAIVAVGDNEQTSREAWDSNHMGDRTSLELVGQQAELVNAILATGTPTVVVLIHGRPLAVNDIAEDAPAILDGWYLGQETGTAVARVLFGDVNPGGKLPMTIPRSVGQLPMYYNAKPSARRGYLFETTEPLWPFGYGLSYTTFEISEPRLSADEIGPDGRVTVRVDVKNTGEYEGDEVVQLYLRDKVSSVTRPNKELKAFQRVTLAPGAMTTVEFEIGPEHLRFYNRAMERIVEPGDFEIMIGPNSVDLKSVTLSVK